MTSKTTNKRIKKRYVENTNESNHSTHSKQNLHKEQWYKRLYKWIVTIDGDVDIPQERAYRSMPLVTNYVFFMGGRLRTLRHTKNLAVIVGFLIIAPMVLFSIFEAKKLWTTRYGFKSMVFLFYYTWTMAISFFIKTATSDPGILPRNIHLSQVVNQFKIPQEYRNIIHLPTPMTKNDPNSKIELKYCVDCKIWRPPRASHCSTCGACIDVHDHHCVYINNCVGKRNYRFFIIFLISSVAASVLLIANSAIHISRNHGRISQIPVTVLLLVYTAVLVWYPITLLSYHIAMTGTQQTTREFLKRIQSSNPVFTKISPNVNNPFDKGSFIHNMAGLMLQPRGLSTVSPRERKALGDWRFTTIPELPTFEKISGNSSQFPNGAYNI